MMFSQLQSIPVFYFSAYCIRIYANKIHCLDDAFKLSQYLTEFLFKDKSHYIKKPSKNLISSHIFVIIICYYVHYVIVFTIKNVYFNYNGFAPNLTGFSINNSVYNNNIIKII